MTTVVVTQDLDDIGHAIEEALEHVPMDALIRGKLVAIKPNETWASAEDTSGVTQPDTLRAMIRQVRQHKPRQIIVTGGAGAGETDDIFRVAGLMDVVESEEVEFFDHNRPPFEEVELTYAPDEKVDSPQKSVMVNPRVLQYETLIALSQLKLHETATVTLALKNIAMSFPAADYYGHPRLKQEHAHHFFDDMHSFIAAMARRFRIDLAVTVGHPAMIATGPIGGHAVETGLVIASTDPVAADVVGARLLGFKAHGVRHLWAAGKLGVGQTEIDRMDFPMLSVDDAIQRFTEAAYGHRLTFQHA